jgi:hypothetical protein
MRNRGLQVTGYRGQGTAAGSGIVRYSLFPVPRSLQFDVGGAR